LSVSGTGSNLVGKESRLTAHLEPFPILAANTRLTDVIGNALAPKLDAEPASYWLNSETAAPNPSDPALTAVTATPKTAATYTQVARQLLLQSPQTRELAAAEKALVQRGRQRRRAARIGSRSLRPRGGHVRVRRNGSHQSP
jgi:hypothetical protein